jgi:hypothetical protein
VRYLLEKSRLDPPISCDGEPAPDRVAPDILVDGVKPGDRPKGDRTEPLGDGSLGDVLGGEFVLLGAADAWGGYPIVRCSLGRVVLDIINYLLLTLIRSTSPGPIASMAVRPSSLKRGVGQALELLGSRAR